MKKVLFILHNLILGGVEKVCYEIVKNLDKEKYKVDFLIAPYENSNAYYAPLFEDLGCKIFKGPTIIGKQGKKDFLAFEKQILQQEHYDIVYSHVDFMNIHTLKTAKNSGGVKQLISHVHTLGYEERNIVAKFKNVIKKVLLNYYATDKLGCSVDACISFYGKHSNYQVFYNAFESNRFINLPKNRDPKKIVSIGRISHEKNPLFIIEVIKELVDIDSGYSLIYVGTGHLFNSVKEKIEEYGLGNNVDLIGPSLNILDYLSQCSLALYPSVSEGLGISIVEAQMSGCFTFFSSSCPKEANLGYSLKLDLDIGAKEWAKTINEYVVENKISYYKLDSDAIQRYDMKFEIKKLEKIFSK